MPAKPARKPDIGKSRQPTRLAAQNPEIARAARALAQTATAPQSRKVSVRVDQQILTAAAQKFGLPETRISDVINAALTLAAAPDPFKAWLRNPGKPLPDDFELAI